MGGWRTGHDFPMDETDLPLIKRLEEKRFRILINKSLNALFVCIVSAQVYECSARVPLEDPITAPKLLNTTHPCSSHKIWKIIATLCYINYDNHDHFC